ncbi:MAG: polysaccharide biosynthesis protein [Spirochaetota bacterium]
MRKRRVLIYGAGEAGRMVCAELLRRDRDWSVAGFVDDDPGKQGRIFEGVPVIGTGADAPGIIRENSIERLIIALPSVHTPVINRTAESIIREFPDISLQILPSVSRYFSSPIIPELEEGRYTELIDREETSFDYGLLSGFYSGKTVIVTGAGGSIGSQLCRTLLRLKIGRLVCIGRGENSLYMLREKTGEISADCTVEYEIADIKSRPSLERIFSNYPGALLLHAAAHKHVPFMESNIHEAVYNNVLGTVNVLEAARRASFSRTVFVSTDKAVNPSSVMGMTKRVCERITASYSSGSMLCTSVRFGNVLGSRGSVIPLFARQIEAGGPVTVTHPGIRRYFMTIPEAAMLVLNAALYSRGGDICLLEMGKMYQIDGIARRMIELSGHVPDKEIAVSYTGLRPGEKLYEELSYPFETLESTDHPRIKRISAPDIRLTPDETLTLHSLTDSLFTLPDDRLRSLLADLITVS